MKSITSIHNSFVKSVALLQDKAKQRKLTGTFIIEGKREIDLATRGGYEIETLMFNPEIFSASDLRSIDCDDIIEISAEVYSKLAYRDTTEGIIAIARAKTHKLSDLKLGANPLILIAEAPEKPGNIGALLRTADAANLNAVIIANPIGDLYNPNIVRSSVGCLFTNQIAVGSTDEIIAFLKQNNISIFCAALQDSVGYHQQDFSQPSAIVVGTEATGLSDAWRKASTKNIIIPMQGQIDSMNVSVAAAVLIFEAKRQRNFS